MIVAGDPAGCAAVGTTLQRAAVGTGATADALQAARATTASWTGVGARTWEDVVSRQLGATDDLAGALHAVGAALAAFAADLEQAQRLAARARALASATCLSLSADGWVPPVHVPPGPHDTPAAAVAAAQAARLAAVREEVLALCAAAREAERAAHERLMRGLRAVSLPDGAPRPRGGLTIDGPVRTWPGWNDGVDLTYGLLMAPSDIAERTALHAGARGVEARRLRDAIAAADDKPAARAAWRAELRAMREARSTAATWAARADRLSPVTRWIGHAGRGIAAVPVARHIPVLSVPLTGVGYWTDRQSGLDARTALAKNVASTATGLGAAALAAGAVTAAPVLAAVVVGAAAGYGVGILVEHWGDDIVEGVGGVADGIGDAVGDAWGKVFG